ncbi:MAG: hypothetical protein NTW49_12560 [Bacteroidia bacterium]|nr:hypothetical protein [Bacteroidia bacterium]
MKALCVGRPRTVWNTTCHFDRLNGRLSKEVGVELVETSRSWCPFGYSPRQVGVRETASLSTFGHAKEVEYE